MHLFLYYLTPNALHAAIKITNLNCKKKLTLFLLIQINKPF